MRRAIALLTLVMILLLVNWSIIQKENHIRDGKVVYIRLAPVDPRSLMQGDYMALRFKLAEQLHDKLSQKDRESGSHDGYLVVTLDEKNIASFGDIFDGSTIDANQTLLQYRYRSDGVKFATNAYFFEEGSGGKYTQAKYGEFRVNKDGEMLLVALAVDDNGTVRAIKKGRKCRKMI